MDCHLPRAEVKRLPEAGSPREAILDLVVKEPGITRTVLRVELGLAWGTVGYHLDRLRRQGRITLHQIGSNTHIMPAELTRLVDTAPAFASPDCRRLLSHLSLSRRPLGTAALSSVLGLTPRQVKHRLDRLAQAGLVRGDGAYHQQFSLTPSANDMLSALSTPSTP